MEDENEKIGIEEAGKLVELNPRSLLRAEKDGRIKFERNAYGDRLITRNALLDSPVLTLGRAAKVAGVRYEVLRYWVRKRKIGSAFKAGGVHATGYLSYNQAKEVLPSLVEYRKARFQVAVSNRVQRGTEAQANRLSLAGLRMILRSVIPNFKLTHPHAHRQLEIQKHFFEMVTHAMQLKALGVDIGKLIPALGEIPVASIGGGSQNITLPGSRSTKRIRRYRRRARLHRALFHENGIGLESQEVMPIQGTQPGQTVKEQ